LRIEAGQHMRMSQQMKLSPRMIQSMEILQLPAMALEERIDQELEENPVLELREVRPEDNGRSADEPDTDRTPEEERPILAHDADAGESTRDDFSRLSDFADSQSDTWQANTSESGESDDYRGRPRAQDGERDAKMDAMANTAARAASLSEQLIDQWRFVDVQEDVHKAGEHLIAFIDDDGYLRTSMQDIVRQGGRHITIPLLEDALLEIQRRLEPAGVGARDLAECLRLQIDARLADPQLDDDEADSLQIARALIVDHLKDIEMNHLPRIAKATGFSMDQVKRGLARMRRLDPRPGRQIAPANHQAVVPDVIIEYDPVHDAYVAALTRGRQPSLRINPAYQRLASDRAQDKATREFLSRSVGNARWLIDAIDQRNNTLLRVVNAVLDVQRDFLDHGEHHLKPLPMTQVADQLGIHVGTVSRAVSEKYLQTPRGIYPLRMFFSGGTESASGGEMSWTAVQAKLKEIIDAEDKANPFNDDELVEKLKDAGLDIARRTVAKYRSQLGIPTARRRREY